MKRVLVKVYRSVRHDGMYLYVAASDGLSRVPAGLLEPFGEAQLALTLMLDAERKLAHADGQDVLDEQRKRRLAFLVVQRSRRVEGVVKFGGVAAVG